MVEAQSGLDFHSNLAASRGEMWLNFARLVGSKPQDCSIGWSLAEDLSGLTSAVVLGTRVGWSFERAHYRSYRAHNYERSPRRLRTWGMGAAQVRNVDLHTNHGHP